MAEATFTWLDWIVVAIYLAAVVLIGWWAGTRRAGDDEFFLAGRGMPIVAVALSVLATSLSAATFIGGPEQAYAGNLTYLSANLGGLLAILIVAAFFLPAFYRHGVTSVYGLLGDAFGSGAQRAASAMFMLGRVFASGARLFIVALPVSLILFGDTEKGHLVGSILIVAAVATLYTTFGGIRAVIWTDTLQAVVVIVSVLAAGWILLERIPLDPSEIAALLRAAGEGDQGKLQALSLSLDPAANFTLWTAVFGWSLFNLAAYGTDQDLVQRMLTCRSARAGSASALLSIVIAWPVVALFLGLGLLLFVFYASPDAMGGAAPAYAPDDTRGVFLTFILHEIPPGLRGLMIAGLFAAAMSSLDSALNAMASTTVADFFRPWASRRGRVDERSERRLARLAVPAWALVLAGFATFCVWWQDASGKTLINFALGVMLYAYTGLLAVFLTALFSKRGNAASVAAALGTGFLTIAAAQFQTWATLIPDSPALAKLIDAWPRLAMPWQMALGTTLALLVCLSGRRREA